MTASEPASTPSAPAASTSPAPSTDVAPRAPRRGSGLAGLAVVLALLALVLAGWSGWRTWQLQRGGDRDSQALEAVKTQLGSLQDKLAGQDSAAQAVQQQLQAARQQTQDLDTRVQGLSERSRSLENAVAGLTASARSGHDAVRLDEAGMLLRMAGERYDLFHDADGALRAYAMADKVLAEVEDPSYTAVRQSITEERKALAATHPGQRQRDLDTLSIMRAAVNILPLMPQAASAQPNSTDFWGRVRQAFSGLVQIRREDAVTPARGELSRTLTALDLAQAQAALLAWDPDGYRHALDRARIRVVNDFDIGDAHVRDFRDQIDRLRGQTLPAAPQLGAALEELHNLRAVHDASTPQAPAASGAGR